MTERLRSNPNSPNYGKHLTRREVIDLFAPGNYSVAKVKGWLASAGIHEGRVSLSANKQVSRNALDLMNHEQGRLIRNVYVPLNQWLQFDAPAHELEDLLLTRYHVFESLKTGVKNIACSQSVFLLFSLLTMLANSQTRYHVPHNVSHHIDYITPGIKLMSGGYEEKVMKRAVTRRHLTGDLAGKPGKGFNSTAKGGRRGKCKPPKPVDPNPVDTGVDESIFKVTGPCSDEITPQCIRSEFGSSLKRASVRERDADSLTAQYQIPNGTRAMKGNELGIFQGLSQHYSPEDLDTYWRNIAP